MTRDALVEQIRQYPNSKMAISQIVHDAIVNEGDIDQNVCRWLSEMCEVSAADIIVLVKHLKDSGCSIPKWPAVCMGLVCYLHGSKTVLSQLTERPELLDIISPLGIRAVECLGRCFAAPVIQVGPHEYAQGILKVL
jgi:NADH:ubiquinone oxidoreductase subunit E